MKFIRKAFLCFLMALVMLLNVNTVFASEVKGQEKADTVYEEFLKEVSFIEDDESWYDGISALLNQYGEDSVNKNIYSQWYEDYVSGGTKEKYFAMTAFEQFLWTESYTRLAYAVGGSGNYNMYFKDELAFENNVIKLVTNLMNGDGNEKVKEAYRKLMAWQYAYVMENGVPYNFINNRNYIEEINQEPVQEKPTVNTEKDKNKETSKDAIQDKNHSGKTEDKGVWSDTMGILSKNAFTIFLLIVLAIAVAFVVYKRKKLNMDDELK